MKSTERYDLAKTKSTESLAEYLFTHIVKHSHNPKGSCACRDPDFDHTYYLTKLDYRKWEQVKQFVLIQSYRPLHTFSPTYLEAWMEIQQLTEGDQNNCSPSIITKFASVLQEKLAACDTAKTRTAFLTLRKKKNY